MAAIMKRLPVLFVLLVLSLFPAACEKHEWEDVHVLHHHGDHDDEEKEGEASAEQDAE